MLGEKLRLEIKTRRKAKPSVARARKTINASVLAPPVRIDRAVEGNVWRLVLGYDATTMIGGYSRLEVGVEFVLAIPRPIILGRHILLALIPATGIRERRASFQLLCVDFNRFAGHSGNVKQLNEQNKNILL